MEIRPLIFVAISLLAAVGCREITEIDLPQEEARLVVEGELTDTPGPHKVRLTLTQPYFSEEAAAAVADAQVWIRDDGGDRKALQYEGNGYYATEGLIGEIGHVYTLEIDWQGMEYQASGRLLPEPEIDSLQSVYYEERPPAFDAGYYILVYGTLPVDASRYYRIKVYENDSLYNDRSDLLIPDDRFLPAEVDSLQLPYPFALNDTVRMEMYTLNREMYDYYIELRTLLFNDGGLFSPPPRNPTGNIRNLTEPGNPPLGYFQVASYSTGTVIIQPANQE